MSDELIYGIHAVRALLQQNPARVKQLWIQEKKHDRQLNSLLQLAESLQLAVQLVPHKTLDKLLDTQHQGVIAACTANRIIYGEEDLAELVNNGQPAPLILVLDGVEDPHNLGACLRSAAAAGVTAVLAPKDRAVGITPVVRKVACGAAEYVPFIRVTNLVRALQQLQRLGLWLYGAAGDAEQTLYQAKLTDPIAIVMGAEGKGLRRLTRTTCDYLIRIPMQGKIESLNVSVATGICLFEGLRQRQSLLS